MQYLALVDYLGNELPSVRSLHLIPGSTGQLPAIRFFYLHLRALYFLLYTR